MTPRAGPEKKMARYHHRVMEQVGDPIGQSCQCIAETAEHPRIGFEA